MDITEEQKDKMKYGLLESQKLQDKAHDVISLSMSIDVSKTSVTVFIHYKNQIALHYTVWWNDSKETIDEYIESAKQTISKIERKQNQ